MMVITMRRPLYLDLVSRGVSVTPMGVSDSMYASGVGENKPMLQSRIKDLRMLWLKVYPNNGLL